MKRRCAGWLLHPNLPISDGGDCLVSAVSIKDGRILVQRTPDITSFHAALRAALSGYGEAEHEAGLYIVQKTALPSPSVRPSFRPSGVRQPVIYAPTHAAATGAAAAAAVCALFHIGRRSSIGGAPCDRVLLRHCAARSSLERHAFASARQGGGSCSASTCRGEAMPEPPEPIPIPEYQCTTTGAAF